MNAKAKLRVVPKGDPQSGQLLIRLPPEELEEVKRLAAAETRSATGQALQLIREALAARASLPPNRR